MSFDLSSLSPAARNLLAAFGDAISDGWLLAQLAAIIGGYVLSSWIAVGLVPVVELQARRFGGIPVVLGVVIAFLRRTRWLVYTLWLYACEVALLLLSGPFDVQLLAAARALAAAWFFISALTRIIRSVTIARIVAILCWGYVALAIAGLDEAVLAAFDRAALTLGAVRISLLLVLKLLVALVSLVWFAVLLGSVLSHWVERSQDLSASFKVLIAKLIKIALIIVAGATALAATGIDLTAITVFSGAVGVGIGFGLQKVVSNFISGIIILLDKSIKPGDTISLGDTFGSIRDLRSRFVSVITRDGREYLIPNEDLITNQVINWSFSSDYVRIDVEFGTSYDSDPHEVSRIAIETAKAVPRVSTHTAPVCWLTGFGASSLDFKLRFWIADPGNGLTNVRGQILLGLWDAFKSAGIGIPFPHREIILKTPVVIQGANAALEKDSR